MHNRRELLQSLFESIEFRLEFFSPGDSRYPPIFRDIRQKAGGPMYRSLRHLNIANPALVENFKSLKISTQLLDNKINLELALSQRTNPDDYSSFHEQLIGTYMIGDGETLELSELAPFGFTPMVAQAVRVMVEDVPLEQVPQVNYTTGLQIISVQKKANSHLVTFKNISEQTICRYALGVDSPTGASGHFAYENLPTQAEESHIFYLQPYSIFQPRESEKAAAHEQSFIIGAAMYDDNSCEGHGHWPLEILLPPSGTRRDHIVGLQALLQRLYAIPEGELEMEIANVRMKAVTLLKSLDFLSEVRVRKKNWAGDELIGNVALGWMCDHIKTFARLSERMTPNSAITMKKTRQEAMEADFKRSQVLLRLLQQSE